MLRQFKDFSFNATQTAQCVAPESLVQPTTNYRKELLITQLCLGVTGIFWLMAAWQLIDTLGQRIHAGQSWAVAEQVLFIVIVTGLIYGNFVYQLTRLGYLRRRLQHQPLPALEREKLYDGAAPALTILVPSYKEEYAVVKRTLISAAMQDYPNRRVVLLVDDPPQPSNAWDKRALDATRALPMELQNSFDNAAVFFLEAHRAFQARLRRGPLNVQAECGTLAALYERAAAWIEDFSREDAATDHGHKLLADKVFTSLITTHRQRAHELRCLKGNASLTRLRCEYNRVAALFDVELACFERKTFENLSHEPNKAMNLNSYIRLLGKSWQIVQRAGKSHLVESAPAYATFHVPASAFLVTLDADSLIVPEYALVLINEMQRNGNERLAVAQTPYNTIPPATRLERIAGATTDIQYLIHQGFTAHGATYWVGANALLRVAALQDIKQTVQERGFDVPIFIQDRTVIEDTESSIDLVARDWRLYNHPERLAFSATPPDFGALLIQRRRWANGGLIILPKLLRHLVRQPSIAKIKEGFFRIHYLASIAWVNIGLLALFGHSFATCIAGAWLPLTAIPYYLLYARDLRYSGYRGRDLLDVYALNLLLIPVNLGGVLKSLQQAITKARIPFGRTPKISGRTVIPALYCLALLALPLFCFAVFALDMAQGHWSHAAFSLVNFLLFVSGLVNLVRVKDVLFDLRTALKSRNRTARTVQPTPSLEKFDPSYSDKVIVPSKTGARAA